MRVSSGLPSAQPGGRTPLQLVIVLAVFPEALRLLVASSRLSFVHPMQPWKCSTASFLFQRTDIYKFGFGNKIFKQG